MQYKITWISSSPSCQNWEQENALKKWYRTCQKCIFAIWSPIFSSKLAFMTFMENHEIPWKWFTYIKLHSHRPRLTFTLCHFHPEWIEKINPSGEDAVTWHEVTRREENHEWIMDMKKRPGAVHHPECAFTPIFGDNAGSRWNPKVNMLLDPKWVLCK